MTKPSEILNIEVERESFLSKIKVSPNVIIADHAALEKTFIEHYCTRRSVNLEVKAEVHIIL